VRATAARVTAKPPTGRAGAGADITTELRAALLACQDARREAERIVAEGRGYDVQHAKAKAYDVLIAVEVPRL
jgi:hypothetical protein